MVPSRFVFLMLGALVASTLAVGETAGKGNKNKGQNPVKAAQDSTLAVEIQSVRALLAAADHDYQGHRVQAIHHLGQAIHHLHKDSYKKISLPRVVEGAGKEAQAVSDAQLAKAIGQVQTIQAQLASLPASPHRARAAGHLNSAVAELQTALKIR